MLLLLVAVIAVLFAGAVLAIFLILWLTRRKGGDDE
jgi:hypothetical protein